MASSVSASSPDAVRPQLFGQLGPDIFTVFSGGNRVLYERAILSVYDELYRSDLLFPTQAEVVRVIYERLSREPALWSEDEAAVDLDRLVTRTGRRVRRRRVEGAHDEATGTVISRSRHIYNRLLQTGWLDESSYGLKTTVEMPSGAMRLAEFLCSLKEGAGEQLGGLVVEVRNAIRAVREKASENALGLNKAARDASSFGRYLRSVLSALRDVDRMVLSSETLADRLRHYFEDFVERVLLRDYTAISTTAHPYRHRRAILTSLDDLEDSDIDLAAIADAYLESRLVGDLVAARDLVQEDIFRIRRVFERIEEAFEAIQQHRSRLETRLRNVVRYAGRRTSFLQRSDLVIQGLDALIARRVSVPAIRGIVEARVPLMGPSLLARPRGSRPAISDADLAIPPPDPIREFRRELERSYLDRLTVSPAKVTCLVIFSGGFPSRPTLNIIARLAEAANVPTYHWGDMDAGGVRIFHHIERRLECVGVKLRPHMMDADLLRRVGSPVADASRLTGETSGSAIADLAQLIRETGLVHEQEELGPCSPMEASGV